MSTPQADQPQTPLDKANALVWGGVADDVKDAAGQLRDMADITEAEYDEIIAEIIAAQD